MDLFFDKVSNNMVVLKQSYLLNQSAYRIAPIKIVIEKISRTVYCSACL
ncbi:hypothetical protein CDIMF43_150090 [Carnobacterium divergens]|nr:hypothetical protein CDIMF43_150090 [Carnobacterium divergens]